MTTIFKKLSLFNSQIFQSGHSFSNILPSIKQNPLIAPLIPSILPFSLGALFGSFIATMTLVDMEELQLEETFPFIDKEPPVVQMPSLVSVLNNDVEFQVFSNLSIIPFASASTQTQLLKQLISITNLHIEGPSFIIVNDGVLKLLSLLNSTSISVQAEAANLLSRLSVSDPTIVSSLLARIPPQTLASMSRIPGIPVNIFQTKSDDPFDTSTFSKSVNDTLNDTLNDTFDTTNQQNSDNISSINPAKVETNSSTNESYDPNFSQKQDTPIEDLFLDSQFFGALHHHPSTDLDSSENLFKTEILYPLANILTTIPDPPSSDHWIYPQFTEIVRECKKSIDLDDETSPTFWQHAWGVIKSPFSKSSTIQTGNQTPLIKSQMKGEGDSKQSLETDKALIYMVMDADSQIFSPQLMHLHAKEKDFLNHPIVTAEQQKLYQLLTISTVMANLSESSQNRRHFLECGTTLSIFRALLVSATRIFEFDPLKDIDPRQVLKIEDLPSLLGPTQVGTTLNLYETLTDPGSLERFSTRIKKQIARAIANISLEPEAPALISAGGFFSNIVSWLRSPYLSLRCEAVRSLVNMESFPSTPKSSLSSFVLIPKDLEKASKVESLGQTNSHVLPNKNPRYLDGVYLFHPQLRDRDPTSHVLGMVGSEPDTFSSIVTPSNNPMSLAYPEYDIVFLHGLLGGPVLTWHSSDSSICWPRDFLASDFPSCRILSIGYDSHLSTILHDSPGFSIQELAEDYILPRLMEARVGQDRPVIFVCHSLGGILLKTALVHASKSRDSHLRNLLSSTEGIAFYSTPHKGAKLARFMSIMSNLFFTTDIVHGLSTTNPRLHQINSEFQSLSHISTLCFVESSPTPILGVRTIVVTPDSGALDYGKIVITQSDHFNVCKPVSIMDPRYSEFVQFVHTLNLNHKNEPRAYKI